MGIFPISGTISGFEMVRFDYWLCYVVCDGVNFDEEFVGNLFDILNDFCREK